MDATRAIRETILGVRLTDDERALIRAQAERDGRTDSGLVRHIVLTHLRISNERPHAGKQEGAPASTPIQAQ